MLQISCPSCGERGKIPAHLVGARIKCKLCGTAFQVPGASKTPAAVGTIAAAAVPASGTTQTFEGITVEGLDPTAWTLAPEQPTDLHHSDDHHEPARPAVPAADPSPSPSPAAIRQYKLLTSRDKIFEGKFDLTRLEEALNHYAQEGWVAKSMCLPHVKNFQGTMHEEVVVLLER